MTIDTAWPEVTGRLRVTMRDGGGHTIRTGRAGPAARGLARAAMRLDGPAVRDLLEMTVVSRGVMGAWDEVIMPVLIGIGERYEATRRFIEVEHLISRCVTEVLGSVPRPPSSRTPRVLLAAADEEQHTLPLEALAAALAESGVPSRLLGARVPPQALNDAVARTGPIAVVLWSQLPDTGDPVQWVRLLSSGHAPLLAGAAGPGWPAERLPEGVVRLGSLREAVHLLAMAVSPDTPDPAQAEEAHRRT
ncbi:B12-binding domain-containing protein [Actinoplanes sp. NPDC049681]|uniref:B12-binding domain-containing protein n=1 Tax=Actinoplanes sp. NPDC049681 TaxID=3363905 RepID=UPI0037B1617D